MATLRTWDVKTADEGRFLAITGDHVAGAIHASLSELARDSGLDGEGRAIEAVAEYWPHILGGRGGIQVTVEWQASGVSEKFVRWVYAPPTDLPDGRAILVQAESAGA